MLSPWIILLVVNTQKDSADYSVFTTALDCSKYNLCKDNIHAVEGCQKKIWAKNRGCTKAGVSTSGARACRSVQERGGRSDQLLQSWRRHQKQHVWPEEKNNRPVAPDRLTRSCLRFSLMFLCLGCLFSEEKSDINEEIKLKFTPILTVLGTLLAT